MSVETFATRLNLLMEETGVSNYRLAKDIGVHQSTIVNWKDGRKPRANRIVDVATYFGVSPRWLKYGELDAGEKMFIDMIQEHRQISSERCAVLDSLNSILSRCPLHKLKALLELLKEE